MGGGEPPSPTAAAVGEADDGGPPRPSTLAHSRERDSARVEPGPTCANRFACGGVSRHWQLRSGRAVGGGRLAGRADAASCRQQFADAFSIALAVGG